MGRYRETVKQADASAAGPPPIWRGIGCLMIFLVPVLSFAAAELTMPFLLERGWIPRELLFTPQTPDWLLFSPTVAQIFQFLFGRYAILATLGLTILYIIFLGGLLTVVYAFLYRMAAPPRYGPMDAPPPRVKIRKYKR